MRRPLRGTGIGLVPIMLLGALGSAPRGADAELSSANDEGWIEVPFDSPRWSHERSDSSQDEHLDRRCLFLRDGLLWLPDADLLDGEVQFDVAVTGERTFVGAAFRIETLSDLERFYIRPHQSGQPDACQYTPMDHGSSAWQLFPDGGTALDIAHDRWITVRLVFLEDVLSVYVDSDKPQLVTRLRREPTRGGLGLQVPGHFAPAHFADFRYRHLDQAPPVLAAEEAPPGAVMRWDVSEAIDEAKVTDVTSLPASVTDGLDWSTLDAEASGVTNLARVQGPAPGADTCFARLRLHAQADTVASINFGFSDRVRVFQEGQLVYTGDDGYRSRDHRFLGTIGLYDRVTLELHEGTNEILFAVSETFGGWGLIAAVDGNVRME